MLLLFANCSPKKTVEPEEEDWRIPYRDTIVGNFSGTQVDTLICEPIDTSANAANEDYHFLWHVYSKAGSVEDLMIDYTTFIRFVAEGDLDGNGTDEWGFVTHSIMSTWMVYIVYTYTNGKGHFLYEPQSIKLDYIWNDSIAQEDLVCPGEIPGTIKVTYTKMIDIDQLLHCLQDTIISLQPSE